MKRLFGLLLLCSTFGAFAMEESVIEVEVKEEAKYLRITEAFNRGELTRELVKEILFDAPNYWKLVPFVDKMKADLIAVFEAEAANPDATEVEQENAKAAALLLDFLESSRAKSIMLIEEGAKMKADYGSTALFKAAQNGHLEICKLLIEKGANVNAQE